MTNHNYTFSLLNRGFIYEYIVTSRSNVPNATVGDSTRTIGIILHAYQIPMHTDLLLLLLDTESFASFSRGYVNFSHGGVSIIHYLEFRVSLLNTFSSELNQF